MNVAILIAVINNGKVYAPGYKTSGSNILKVNLIKQEY